ncbi:type 1 glutamine amidotransferase domain-containing protein [Shewanella sp. NIFS-20-20]|uniref:type 1 glutamine amidotransferase domain-containing protein n=1 Tax=Shewanella sp. NIFS-20-20 TaxID=2853806 RepID=UPI001C4617D6|nr:type 1 glutamine amidotransferase domain-containing protein [Shewanella sp. NIFS-20-20]MBV7315988.1 type 1 glutamine amidotransferase domain-containing protein [Shewanella sp. NIFS-20-20]
MKILFVLTSHDTLGNTGLKTGFWLEEFAAPYYAFKDQGHELVLASPLGGQPPLDPNSDAPESHTDATVRFSRDTVAQAHLAGTLRLRDVVAADYDAVFYPGGHGPLWDLAEDKDSIALIEAFDGAHKPIGLVCHAPAALKHVKSQDGSALVAGKSVTGFSNSEEAAVQLTAVVPFLVEDMLKANGGLYAKGDDWSSFVSQSGHLITGQNPASSVAVADAMMAQFIP